MAKAKKKATKKDAPVNTPVVPDVDPVDAEPSAAEPLELPTEVKDFDAMLNGTAAIQLRRRIPGVARKVNAKHLEAGDITDDTALANAIAEAVKGSVATDADAKSVAATKLLLKHKALTRAINTVDAAIFDVEKYALPKTPFYTFRFVPLANVPKVVEALNARKALIDAAVEDVVAALPEMKADAKERLASLYNEAEFPTEAALRASFSISWNWLSVDTAAGLKGTPGDLYEAERAKLRAEYEETAKEVRLALRAAMLDVLSGLHEALTGESKPGPDGKLAKRLPGPAIKRVLGFIAEFDAKNILGDESLSSVADDLRATLTGIDAETLKADKFKAAVGDYVGATINTVKGLVVEAKGRLLDLGATL